MSSQKKIFIACDHAGLPLKKSILEKNPDIKFIDLGTNSETSVDYPDFVDSLAKEMQKDIQNSVGILICGSGQGMAIRANRFQFLRAALCWSEEVAKLSRAHNNANVLCMGSRLVEPTLAHKILLTFLNTPFEGGRHENRVRKLSKEC